MFRIGSSAVALTGLLLSGITFGAIAPATAQAPCSLWRVDSHWRAIQSNGPVVNLVLQQTGNNLRGKAYYSKFIYGRDVNITGPVDGSIKGNSIRFTIFWSDGAVGAYSGVIGSTGRIEGFGYDKRNPKSRAAWYSQRRMDCIR